MNPESNNVYHFRPSQGRLHILIVDDDATVRKILCRMLTNSGYRISEAASGKDALKVLDANQITLILLDIVMPEMNGIDVLKTIRKSYTVSELPVVMVSIKDNRDDVTRALSLGANDYVIKPIDFPVLQARIESQLAHKMLEDELRRGHNELERRVNERTASLLETKESLEKEIQVRNQVEKKIRENTEYFQSLISHAQDIIAVFETDGTVYYESPAIRQVLGYTPEERIGKNTFDLIHPDDRKLVMDRFIEAFSAPGKVFTESARFRHKNGTWRMLESTGRTIVFQGRLRGIVNARDITERSLLTEQLYYHTSHDALTGLINRLEFQRRLDYIRETQLHNEDRAAILYIDLDQFKVINETCGNLAGDELLKEFSSILLSHIGKYDIIARLGGDEFGILLNDCDIEMAIETANNILTYIEDFRFNWSDRVFTMSASIGLIPINQDQDISHNLLELAESACYAAKDAGRNQVHVYDRNDTVISQREGEMLWVSNINQALLEDQFCLYKQPIVPITSVDGKVANGHYELLLRMRDKNNVLIPPNDFLPVAERYNLSTRLDRWVINAAFSWLMDNPSDLHKFEQFSINLSGLSLGNEAILAYIIKSLKSVNIPPGKICFEITETAAISNMSNAAHFINTLRAIGCRFALDDFGSGLSSFGYLKNLPIDYLKIDGMFIREIHNDIINLAMVKSINEIGKAMDKLTIAECVESENVLDKLREIGVDFAQGYHIGKPIHIDENH